MKNELVGKMMTNLVALRLTMYNYLKDNGYIVKKVTSAKKCMVKGN